MITFRKLGRLGRLGNQLFQYAGTNLYAYLNNYRAVFPRWIGNQIFEGVVNPYSPIEKLKSLVLPTCQLDDLKSYNQIDKIKFILGIDERLPQITRLANLYLNPKDNLNFYSQFQDEFSLNLLKKHKNIVHKWFSFKKDIENDYKNISEGNEWIGVHVRRGDFVKRSLGVPIKKYLELLKDIAYGQKIYIATDDKKVKAEFGNFKLLQVSNPRQDIPEFIFDFWMLKNSKIIIGGGSTFSWWAAFLNEKGKYFSPPLTHLWLENYKPVFQEVKI